MTNMDKIKVMKRDGRLEPIDLDKIHKVITWAAEGLDNVSVSQVELKSHIQFYDGIKTRDIHETSIWPPVWPSSTYVKLPTINLSHLTYMTTWLT